ncbi:MAG: carbohydrate kinase family protein [bacterium]
MIERRGFLTAGCWCVDRNITVPFWPGEDVVVRVSGNERAGGGSACNLAVDIRKLDASVPVWTTGVVGADEAGDFLKSVAKAHGIDHSQLVQSAAAPTQVTDAYMSAASGRRTHVLFEGSNNLLSPENIVTEGSTAKIFHLGLPGIHAIMDAPWGSHANGWAEVLQRAHGLGMLTSFELVTVSPERIRALVLPCLPYLSLLVVNDFEIGALAGMDTVRDGVTDRAAVQAAAEKVLAVGAMAVVAVHYVTGATLVSRQGDRVFKPSVKVPEQALKGANGAGDAFAAGFLYGVHEGWAYDRCLQLAHASAAACIRTPGTYDGLMSVADCLALAADWGWR